VGPVEGAPGVVLAAAWSGGGFKTAPAAGELAADAACTALEGAIREPIDRHGGDHADPRH
jgi:sarcosine oxidase